MVNFIKNPFVFIGIIALSAALILATLSESTKVRVKNNKDLVSLSIIGQCLFHEGNYDEAIKIFESILQIDSKNISALNSLARTYHEKHEKELKIYFT